MVSLPTSAPAAASWQLVDFLRMNVRTEPATGGQASLDVGQLPGDELWVLDRCVSQCIGTLGTTTLHLYESMADPTRLLDGTSNGNFNVAEWPTGLQIGPSSSLVAVWFGASNGARGYLGLQGRRYVRAS